MGLNQMRTSRSKDIICRMAGWGVSIPADGKEYTIKVKDMTTKSEILDEIAKAEEHIAKLKEKAKTLPDETKGRWKPSVGEKYWYLITESPRSTTWSDDIWDNALFPQGNVYQTLKEAEAALDAKKVHYELMDLANFEPDWKDSGQSKFYLLHSHAGSGIRVDGWTLSQSHGQVWFRSPEEALAAVDKVGKERVIRYLCS